MVLGLTLRRKRTKEPQVRPSPSLPDIHATGILDDEEWPENLLDMRTIRLATGQLQTTSTDGEQVRSSNAETPVSEMGFRGQNKASFQSTTSARGIFPAFHRPFKSGNSPNISKANEQGGTKGRASIASLYVSQHPPSAFGRSTTYPYLNSKPSLPRLARSVTKFNLMVAGARGAGKTSFLRLLLETCDISPAATEEQRASLAKFARGYEKRTKAFRTTSIEICEDRHERILLKLIDTPGLDFDEDRELELERGISHLVKYLDTQFAETMGEESKIVRKNSEGNQHVHLLIYLIDPDSVMRPSAQRAKSLHPHKLRSQSAFNRRPSLSSISSDDTSDSSDDEGIRKESPDRETISPADLRVIKALSNRCNVLPVVARSDTLTDTRLATIKQAIRRDLVGAGLGFGILGDGKEMGFGDQSTSSSSRQRTESNVGMNKDDDDDERQPRQVIQIKSTRRGGKVERSSSRRRMMGLGDEDYEAQDYVVPSPVSMAGDPGVPASPMTPWSTYSKSDVEGLLPFAILSPELPKPPRRTKIKPKRTGEPNTIDLGSEDANEIRQTIPNSSKTDDVPRRRLSVKQSLANLRTTADLQGKYLRQYRWGTIDVMDPNHCDFVALRSAILGLYLNAFKNNTKEVLYENYRTEKLLARRATKNITDEGRARFLQELGV